jgi:hypothetical protein
MKDYSVVGSNAKHIFSTEFNFSKINRKESNRETRKVLFPIMSRDGRNTEIVMCSVNKVNRLYGHTKKRGSVRKIFLFILAGEGIIWLE